MEALGPDLGSNAARRCCRADCYLVVNDENVVVVERNSTEDKAIEGDTQGPDIGSQAGVGSLARLLAARTTSSLNHSTGPAAAVPETLRRGEGGRAGRVGEEGVRPVELIAHTQVGDLHLAVVGPQ